MRFSQKGGRRKLSAAPVGPVLTLVLLLVASSIPAGFASNLMGKYVEYQILVDSPTRSTAGTLRQEVVEDYGDETVLVRYSGNFSRTRFSIEKVVNSSSIGFPYLPAFPDIFFSTVIGNLNVTVVSELVGTETVTFNGSDWTVSIMDFSLLVSPLNASVTRQATLEGTLKTFVSGLVYSITASGQVDSGEERTLTLTAQLKATSIDPEAQVFAGSVDLLGFLGVESFQSGASFDIRATGEGQDSPQAIATPLILASLLGFAASVVYVRRRRNKRRETSADAGEEKPLYWVH